MKPQVLLEQAEGCLDATVDHILRNRDDLMADYGMSAFTLGQITFKLADAIGELHKVRRLLPGYNRQSSRVVEE